ncbi:polysaccharide chain length determinant protein (PEP-CTERM system associated) [Chitinivorax tropicus]|uniref:Polysaccharide chain length determinant protein (PEP-CTERM system associated) n=1 Tax=Chitinivorax tropicus TaxID=714531 RepID=A0A840MR07_9PROT|nr:XrtA system polysaccharide chain length determinant [Chitinivorax tropicus]MBB5018876.1 polysaccharide chain length determinant protein (PEP-CTERM system associated) [Chitinivorax tropicus]
MSELLAQLASLLRAAWNFRWYALASSWVLALGGWIFVYTMPDRFESSARVYVDTQSMLKPLMNGIAVQPNVDQQISIMSKTLISRPNIEKVIRMADLDLKIKTAEEKESLIDRLTKRISIKSTGRDNLFEIGYEDTRPETARNVVQALMTIFVEGSLGDKRKDADTARRFLDEQIKAYELKLVQAENALKEFKRQHIGQMPEDGKDYYSQLTAVGGALNQAKLELAEAQRSRDAIKSQLAGDELVVIPQQGDDAAGINPELDARIQALKKNLDSLRLNYTEQHPDIIAAKRIIDQLEDQRKQEAKTHKPATYSNQNPGMQQLKMALVDAEARVAALTARVGEYTNRFNQFRAAANAIPQVEADFTQLNRDYQVNKQNYENLLARRESAHLSGEMDASANVVDFRVIDPPRLPSQPSAPNRPLLMIAVLGVAVAGGLAVALLLSQLRPTFNSRRELRDVTGLPILGSISMIWTPEQRRKSRQGAWIYASSYAGLLVMFGLVMAFQHFVPRSMLM